MINFCHIAPVDYLNYVKRHKVHLLLAHLVEENETYRNFYINLKKDNPEVFYHMDNSAFEMFKRGVDMYPTDKLIEMGKLVNADSIVMSDYPKEHYLKTVESAVALIPQLKEAGFKTFFCPQSELGQINDLIGSFDWAIHNPNIDYIGVSILACPIGVGVNEQQFRRDENTRDASYRMQRYLSRWKVFELLNQHKLLGKKTHNRFHCLGLTDGPNEIDLLKPYHKHIFSWDSSSAIWHGVNRIRFDDSPTGLRFGKYEQEVEFNHRRPENVNDHNDIVNNINYVDKMCE